MVATRRAKEEARKRFGASRTKRAAVAKHAGKLELVQEAVRFKLVEGPISSERAIDKAMEKFKGDPRLRNVQRPSRQAVDKLFARVPEECKTVIVRTAMADITNAPAHVQMNEPANSHANAPANSHANAPANSLANAPANSPENVPATTRENAPTTTRENAPATTRENAPATTQADDIAAARVLAGLRPINILTGKPRKGRPPNSELVGRRLLEENARKLEHEAYQRAVDMYKDTARDPNFGFRRVATAVSALPRYAENVPRIVVTKTILQRVWVATGEGTRPASEAMARVGRPQLIPSSIENDIAAVVDWMLEEGYRVTKEIVKEILCAAIAGTELHGVFDGNSGVPTDGWFAGWRKRTGMTTALSQPLDTERSEWLNSSVFAKHYKTVANILIRLKFAESVDPHRGELSKVSRISFSTIGEP